GSVDGRPLALPRAQDGVHVQEMVEPTSVTDIADGIGTLGFFVERPQRPYNSLATLLACDPTVVDSDTDSRQPKTDSGDAAMGVGSGTVADQAVCRIRFEPEVIEGLSLNELEKVGVAWESVWLADRRFGQGPRQRGQAKRNQKRSDHAA